MTGPEIPRWNCLNLMKTSFRNFVQAVFLILLSCVVHGQGLNPQAQQKIDQIVASAQDWAKENILVNAVEAQNRQQPATFAAMTQDKWESLPDADPFVRAFTTNPVAELLKQKKPPGVSEAFVSDASGCKVAFLAKTTSWCHKGKPKHDVPMSGHTWQGKLEVDRSTGGKQLQISVPVLVDGKPAGSLVVGISVSALTGE